MNKLKIFVVLFLLFSCNHPESNEHESKHGNFIASSSFKEKYAEENNSQNEYKVIGVKDGDTFVILMAGKEQTVRFAHIDCPEKKQPFGTQAKLFVSERCFGKYVTLIHKNKFDRNKRLIAEVILKDGTNLSKALIENGLAWHYKKYSTDNSYTTLEIQAKQNKIGLWADKNPIPPWNWR